MLNRLSILARFSLCICALLALLLASAGAGIFGLNRLYGTVNRSLKEDVLLAQRAARIDILVLNERRFEKDAFINLADGEKLASYRSKWDEARAELIRELGALHDLQ